MLAALALATIASSPAPESHDPYEIFAQARRYWDDQHYPGMLEYTVAVRVDEGGVVKVERYRCGYDGYQGVVEFDPVSDYEAAHPYVPHGLNVSLPFFRIGKPEPPVDYLGVPDFAPNYAFGIGDTPLTPLPHSPTPAELVREIRQQFNDPDPRATPTPAPSPTPGLRQIATVISRTQTYDISLVGIDDLDGESAYHLKMHPVREPHKYRLRDLWVDTASYAPRKLVEALNFVDGPGTGVPWTVTFADVAGALYIDRETALAPMRYRGLIYTGASVSVEDLHEVTGFSADLSTFQPGGLMMDEP